MTAESNDWLESAIPLHNRLTERVLRLLNELLDQNNIDVLSLAGRTKHHARILQKIDRKGYVDPQKQLTDLSGFRIVCFLEGDIERVVKLIRDTFDVDEDNSLDKSALLGKDKTGYRSQHFVCSLPRDRVKLQEWSTLAGLKFEIQVRTSLQHAWAEIAHDRQYKFEGKLPEAIQRRLNLYAGLLELADSGFQQIADEIDAYNLEIRQRASRGDLRVPLDTLSITEYLQIVSTQSKLDINPPWFVGATALAELEKFGTKTLYDLDEMLSESFLRHTRQFYKHSLSALNLFRNAMIMANPERYFRDVYNGRWSMTEEHVEFFTSKIGAAFGNILNKYRVLRSASKSGPFGITITSHAVTQLTRVPTAP